MKKLEEFKQHLKSGSVYRRADLVQWSTAVDRHLRQLKEQGFIEKLSSGLYYVPKMTVFGAAPPDEEVLIRSFLKDDDFLMTSPNAYNTLGIGTTQLYNKRIVYNHKRHGEFVLGGRKFYFHAKHKFPRALSPEFLLVDLVNNLERLAEDGDELLRRAAEKARGMDRRKLLKSVSAYGNARAKAFFSKL